MCLGEAKQNFLFFLVYYQDIAMILLLNFIKINTLWEQVSGSAFSLPLRLQWLLFFACYQSFFRYNILEEM